MLKLDMNSMTDKELLNLINRCRIKLFLKGFVTELSQREFNSTRIIKNIPMSEVQ